MKKQTQDPLCVSSQIVNFMRCCTCRKTISLRGRLYGLKLALISCGHTQCENCSRLNSICSICKTDYQRELDKCHKTLSINAYLMGHSFLAKKVFPIENLISYKVTRKPNIKSIEEKVSFSQNSNFSCYECIKKIATKGCQQCKANFCDSCWLKIHTIGKILQKHISVEPSEHNRDYKMLCQFHEMQDLEFYCKVCREYICSLCIVLNHQGTGHRVITLEEKQNGLSEEFCEIVEEVEKNLKKLVGTYEEVEEMITNLASDSSYIEIQKQVVNKFGHLHGLLQITEESIINKLAKVHKDKLDALQEIQYNLEDEISLCEQAVQEFNSWKKSSGMKRERRSLQIMELLLKARSQPSVLVPINNEQNEEKQSVSFNDNIIHSLMDYCTLSNPVIQTYRLVSMFTEENSFISLNEDFTKYENFESERRINNFTNYGSFTSVIENLRNKERNDYFPTKAESLSGNLRIVNVSVTEGSLHQVIVSHVKSPEEFFIRFTSMKSKLTELEYRAQSFAIRNTYASPKDIQKDNFYLTFCTTTKKWNRARIVEDLPEDINENSNVLVYYLDFGVTKEVSISRLKPMPAQLLEENPLAMKCKLFDCVPKTGTWCEDSINLMRNLLTKSLVTMYVMKILPDCWEVDLSATHNDCLDSELHSLRDCMIFLEYASFVAGPSKKINKYHDVNFVTPILPNIGDQFHGVISYIQSASRFFVQKLFCDTKYMIHMMNKMESAYCKENPKELIYNPIIGMPCVAKYSQDNKWYRAKVIDLPGNKSVTVLYVDFGNEETIPWNSIRKIRSDFIKLAPQALHCSLAKMLPMEDYQWGSKAKDYLIKNSNKKFWIKVIAKDDPVLKVALYLDSEQKTSINIQLMKQDCSFMENHSPIMENDICNDISSESTTEPDLLNLSGTEFYPNFNEKNAFINRKDKKLFQKCKRSVIIEKEYDNLEGMTLNKNNSEESDKAYRTEVEILSVTSPSDIYVSARGLKFKLKELERSLQEHYHNSEVDKEKIWKVNDKCAAFSMVQNKWYRSTITKIMEDNMYEVYFKDIGISENVSLDNIRNLNKKFSDYPAGAIKCHLYGISPPENEWPGITCEFLKNELQRYQNVFMTGMGDLNKGSLPVRLWLKQITYGGALEPSYEEWVTINDLIVSQGLAIPEKYKLMMDFEKFSKHSEDVEVIVNKTATNDTEKLESDKNLNTYNRDLKSDLVHPVDDRIISCAASEYRKFITSKIEHIWSNHELPVNDEFVGVTTYVDYQNVLYLHDFDKDASQLHLMKEIFSQFHSDLELKDEYQCWEINQICAVQYYLDKKWYRGKVFKKISNLTYEVLFVDYGNVEVCSVKEMRKEITFLDVPILARKCLLHGISPVTDDGKWRKSDIDYIYGLIVEKKCQITVIEKSNNVEKPSSITLTLNTGINLADHLVSRGMAKFNVNHEEDNEKKILCEINDSDENHLKQIDKIVRVAPMKYKDWTSNYIKLEIPEELSILKIDVLKVSLAGFNARILDHSHLPKNIRFLIRNYEAVLNEIQEMAPSQATLPNYIEGEPCICLYLGDNQWYRAEITNADYGVDRVGIRYVDYGNEEVVEKWRIRCSLRKWIEVPILYFFFKLRNIKKAPSVDRTNYLMCLSKCLNACDRLAYITNRNSKYLEVEVTSEADSRLVYQEMLDSGLMEVTNSA